MVKTNFFKANFLLILLALVSLGMGFYVNQQLEQENQSAKVLKDVKSNE